MKINLYQLGDDSHLYRDATEKVLILRKAVQDKVYLYVFHYYILYVKTVFQWRRQPPAGGFPILCYAKHPINSIMKKTKKQKQQRKRNQN